MTERKKALEAMLERIKHADTSATFAYDLDDLKGAVQETLSILRALIEQEGGE